MKSLCEANLAIMGFHTPFFSLKSDNFCQTEVTHFVSAPVRASKMLT